MTSAQLKWQPGKVLESLVLEEMAPPKNLQHCSKD